MESNSAKVKHGADALTGNARIQPGRDYCKGLWHRLSRGNENRQKRLILRVCAPDQTLRWLVGDRYQAVGITEFLPSRQPA